MATKTKKDSIIGIEDSLLYEWMSATLEFIYSINRGCPESFDKVVNNVEKNLIEWIENTMKDLPVENHMKRLRILNTLTSSYVIYWHMNGAICVYNTRKTDIPDPTMSRRENLFKGHEFTVDTSAEQEVDEDVIHEILKKSVDIALSDKYEYGYSTMTALNKAYLRYRMTGSDKIRLKQPEPLKSRIRSFIKTVDSLQSYDDKVDSVRKTVFELLFQPDIIADYVADAYQMTKYVAADDLCYDRHVESVTEEETDEVFVEQFMDRNSRVHSCAFLPGYNNLNYSYSEYETPFGIPEELNKTMLKKYDICRDNATGTSPLPSGLEQTLISLFPDLFTVKTEKDDYWEHHEMLTPVMQLYNAFAKINNSTEDFRDQIQESIQYDYGYRDENREPFVRKIMSSDDERAWVHLIRIPGNDFFTAFRNECMSTDNAYDIREAMDKQYRHLSPLIKCVRANEDMNFYHEQIATSEDGHSCRPDGEGICRLPYDRNLNAYTDNIFSCFWKRTIPLLICRYHETRSFDETYLKELVDAFIEELFPTKESSITKRSLIRPFDCERVHNELNAMKAAAEKMSAFIDHLTDTLLKSDDIQYLTWLKSQKQINPDKADARIAEIKAALKEQTEQVKA